MLLRAKYVLDRDFSVIENGAVRIEGELIAEVGRYVELAGEPVEDLGEVIILPGFVNAHTHLQFGYAAGKVPPSPDFTGWLWALMAESREAADDPTIVEQAVVSGLKESLRAGTLLIGDVVSQPGLVRQAISASCPRPDVLSFGEVIAFGTVRSTAAERIAAACDSSLVDHTLRIGLSPHAPYSVEPDVLSECVRLAKVHGLRLAIHAAETLAEEEYTTKKSGPFVDYFQRLGVWDDKIPFIGNRPIRFLHSINALGETTLLAHVNYPDSDDLDLLRETGTHVAYCPRTHRAFEHSEHRFRDMIKRGINVCIGTDSLASSPSLSVLDELRFLRMRYADIPSTTLLQMGTHNGAAALGVGTTCGLLCPGYRANLVGIPLNQDGPQNPVYNILAGSASCMFSVIGGVLIHS